MGITQLSLEQVIEQKLHRTRFYNLLCSEHSEESLEFILSVRKLNRLQDSRLNFEIGRNSQIKSQAKSIYEVHIKQGSEKEINILYKTRKNIEDAMASNLKSNEKEVFLAFDKAREEIYALLRRDSWPRFLAACS